MEQMDFEPQIGQIFAENMKTAIMEILSAIYLFVHVSKDVK